MPARRAVSGGPSGSLRSAAVYVSAPAQGWLEIATPELARFLRTVEGPTLTVEQVLADLDARKISGAVLYPSNLWRAFAELDDAPLVELCRLYDDWILALCAHAPERLFGVVLLAGMSAADATLLVPDLARRGAAGAILPLFPHTSRRYDALEYEPLWRVLAAQQLPVVFHRGTTREILSDPMPFDLVLQRVGDDDRLFEDLLDVFEVSYARLAVVSMILSGVFWRHPTLQVVVTGYGAGWVPYTLLRMDGQYLVRPERVGQERVPARSAPGEGAGTGDAEAGDAALEERHAFAREREGFSFPTGVVPSDHFHRNVYVGATGTRLDLDVRDDVGAGHLMWASGHAIGSDEVVASPLLHPDDADFAAFSGGVVQRVHARPVRS